MKYQSPLLAVKDLEKSESFYYSVLGLEVILDFGNNITLTGGISLQTKNTWMEFIHKEENELIFEGNVSELYFEEDNFDDFILRLHSIEGIRFVHPVVEHSGGQRAVRFYDLDGHIIEVGENIIMVVRRFLNNGLSVNEAAVRMDVSVDYIKSCME